MRKDVGVSSKLTMLTDNHAKGIFEEETVMGVLDVDDVPEFKI